MNHPLYYIDGFGNMGKHLIKLIRAHFWSRLFRASLVFSGANFKPFWTKYRCFFGRRFLAVYGACGEQVNFCKHIRLPPGLRIGNRSGIGDGSRIEGEVTIGENVMMGCNCFIFTTNHEFSDISTPMINQGMRPCQAVIIGNDVWIGANVIILPGVRIGEGSVIGAGSVVTHDIEPYTVNAGNPCRLIRKR